MVLNFDETKFLIDRVLEFSRPEASTELKVELALMKRTRQAFYEGVIQHGPWMNFYTSDQWLDFHQMVPHWRLRRERALLDKFSPKHREMLEES